MESSIDKIKTMLSLPEVKSGLSRIKQWNKYYEQNPTLCPHPLVTGPISMAGMCLVCGKEEITAEMQGNYPEGLPGKDSI